jgi:hypothetical protein
VIADINLLHPFRQKTKGMHTQLRTVVTMDVHKTSKNLTASIVDAAQLQHLDDALAAWLTLLEEPCIPRAVVGSFSDGTAPDTTIADQIG